MFCTQRAEIPCCLRQREPYVSDKTFPTPYIVFHSFIHFFANCVKDLSFSQWGTEENTEALSESV